jgi:hypothetical protein
MRYVTSKSTARSLDDPLVPVIDVFGESAEPYAVLRIVPLSAVPGDRVDHTIRARLEISSLELEDLDRLILEAESARQQIIAIKGE